MENEVTLVMKREDKQFNFWEVHKFALHGGLTPHLMDKELEIVFYSTDIKYWFEGVEVTHNFDLLIFTHAQRGR